MKLYTLCLLAGLLVAPPSHLAAATNPYTAQITADPAFTAWLLTNGVAGSSSSLGLAPKTRLIFDGDSLTARSDSYARAFMTNSPYAGFWNTNVAISGTTAAQIFSRYTANVHPWAPAGGTNAVLLVWMGANSMMMSDPLDNTWTYLTNEWETAKADGFAIVAFTLTPRGDMDYLSWQTEQNRVLLNNLIRRSTNWDYLIDVAARFETVNATDFRSDDLVHQTTSAAAETATMVCNALRQGPLSTPGWTVASTPRWAADYGGSDLFGADGTWYGSITIGGQWTLPTLTVANTALGNESIVNGGFDTTAGGWTADLSTLSSVTNGYAGNCLKILSQAGAYRATATQKFTLATPGGRYHLSFLHLNGTVGGGIAVGSGWYGQDYYSVQSLDDAAWTQHAFDFTTTTTNIDITLYANTPNANDTSFYDSVSLKQEAGSVSTLGTGGMISDGPLLGGSYNVIGMEAVTNGNFESGASIWTLHECTASAVTGGVLGNCIAMIAQVNTDWGSILQQAIPTVAGQTYLLSYWHKNGTAPGYVICGSASYASDYWQGSVGTHNDPSWTRHTATFTATGTLAWLQLYDWSETAGQTTYYDEVSLRPLATGITLTNTFYGTTSTGSGIVTNVEVLTGGIVTSATHTP